MSECERHDWSPVHLNPNIPGRELIVECLTCGKVRRRGPRART
jgi:hypothetical protein